MIKNFTILILLLSIQNLSSQTFDDKIQDISNKICQCANEIRKELNDKSFTNCFNKVYSVNNKTMSELLKESEEKYNIKSEFKNKAIIGNLINEKLSLQCDRIGDYISKK